MGIDLIEDITAQMGSWIPACAGMAKVNITWATYPIKYLNISTERGIIAVTYER